MRSSILAVALLGFASSPVHAEATVQELTERVEKLEKTVETLVGGMSFFADDQKLKAADPGAPDEGAVAEVEVVINVKADGMLQVEGQQLTLEQLGAKLTKLAEKNKDQPVRLRGDAAVEYQRMVEVIDTCQKAGLWKVSFATQRADQDAGHEECEDNLVAVADVVPDLDSGLFKTSKTSRQPWIVENDGGGLEDTVDGSIDADDLLFVEHAADCVSNHQGEHAMEFCDAVKTADGVEFELAGGAPAYMSNLKVTIDAKRQFVCRFNAIYPSASGHLHWKVTKKAMKLKTAPGEPGARLCGWISVEFDEIDGGAGGPRHYKVEGFFKPVIQNAPAADPEEDK